VPEAHVVLPEIVHRVLQPSVGARVVRIADLAGTAVFAVEGALAAAHAGFDLIGILVLAFVTALGGGVVRDLMLDLRPAAIARPEYAVLVILGALATALPASVLPPVSSWPVTIMDAVGLSLFAVAGTEKALENAVHPLPACFLGTVGAVGGGVTRDLLLNEVPHVLNKDIYATAALFAAVIVVVGRTLKLGPRRLALIAALACFALRIAAVAYGWQLPRLP
jgi:uncharacterized membrane protein YeiH